MSASTPTPAVAPTRYLEPIVGTREHASRAGLTFELRTYRGPDTDDLAPQISLAWFGGPTTSGTHGQLTKMFTNHTPASVRQLTAVLTFTVDGVVFKLTRRYSLYNYAAALLQITAAGNTDRPPSPAQLHAALRERALPCQVSTCGPDPRTSVLATVAVPEAGGDPFEEFSTSWLIQEALWDTLAAVGGPAGLDLLVR